MQASHVKSLLKQLLVPALASRPVSAIASRIFGTGIPIFMLHRMAPDNTPGEVHTPSFLRRCLQYLKGNGYSFVSLENIIEHLHGSKTLPPKPVAFTVDDGFEDQASLAAPVFIEYECPATIFLITGMLDDLLWPWFCQVEYLLEHTRTSSITLILPDGRHTFALDTPENTRLSAGNILQSIKEMDWDAVPGILTALADATDVEIPERPPAGYKPLSWDQARYLEKRGISFGPHTISHPILSRVDDRRAEQEICGSWQRLKEELAAPSRVFCYPNGRLGDFGKREIELVKGCDLAGALSTVPDYAGNGKTRMHDHLYMIPRFALPGDLVDFLQYCTWIEYAKQKLR